MCRKVKGKRKDKKVLAARLFWIAALAGLSATAATGATISADNGVVLIENNQVITGTGAETLSDGDTVQFQGYNAGGGSITIQGSTMAGGTIYGGWAQNSYCSDNSVLISDSTLSGSVTIYGGYIGAYGTNVTGNSVTIDGSTVDGTIYGGRNGTGDRAASNNIVTVQNGSTVNGTIYGGEARYGDSNENQVIIENSNVTGDIYGGRVTDISLTNRNANNNSVTIRDSVVTGNVYGGYTAGYQSNSQGNSVTIENSTVTGDIRGTYSGVYNTGMAASSDQTVTLRGDCDVSGSRLFGFDGSTSVSSGGGHSLILDGYSGLASTDAAYVDNFDTLIFRNGTERFIADSVGTVREVHLEAKNLAGDYGDGDGFEYTVTISSNIVESENTTGGVTHDLEGYDEAYLYSYRDGGAICK